MLYQLSYDPLCVPQRTASDRVLGVHRLSAAGEGQRGDMRFERGTRQCETISRTASEYSCSRIVTMVESNSLRSRGELIRECGQGVALHSYRYWVKLPATLSILSSEPFN